MQVLVTMHGLWAMHSNGTELYFVGHAIFSERNYKDLMKPLEIHFQCDTMEMTKTGKYRRYRI